MDAATNQSQRAGWQFESAGRPMPEPVGPDYTMRTDDGARGYFTGPLSPASCTQYTSLEASP
jgi:hypothetical protein